MSYNELTPIGSLLYAIEVPPAGGNTGFSNMYAVYDSLPADLKRAIVPLQCRHDSSRNSAGGAFGVLFGILGGNLLAFFLELPPVIPVDWVLLGLAICSVVGIVFGTYPAWKAANLDPIESLRYE